MLVIVMPCCSTSLAKGTSQTKGQARRYYVKAISGLGLVEVMVISVHMVHHLMVIDSANQMQISLVIVFQLMMVV
jgi:hypothetical protein